MNLNYRFFRSPDPYMSMSEVEEAAAEARRTKPTPEPAKPELIIPGDGKDKPVIPAGTPPEGKIYAADGVSLVDDPNYKKPEPVVTEPPAGKKFDVDGKTLIDDPDYKAPEEEVEEPFWDAVEKHTGIPIKVTYPEGVEPASVEGAALREQAVIEYAINDWETKLRDKYPRAFAYMVHHMDGGSDAEFLNNERGISLPERATVEGSVDVQTTIYKNDLLNKGVDADIADAQIAKAIKDNSIKDKALKVYDGVQKAQVDELALITDRNKKEAARVDGVIKQITTSIEKTMPELSFVVPDSEKKAFQDYFLDNLQYDKKNDTFALVVPVKGEDLKSQMEAMFLQFKKGDLSKIIQRKVATKAAQLLKVKADKTKTPTPNQQEDRKDQTSFIPLGSLG